MESSFPAPSNSSSSIASSIPAPSNSSNSSHVVNPLRIIEVVHAFEPRVGGIETHVQELSLALARAGAQVVVHTARPGMLCGGSSPAIARQVADVDARLAGEGVIVKRHFAISLPVFSSLVWMPGLPLFIMLEKGDAVMAHGYGALTPFCASIGSLLSGKRFFWTIHGLPRFGGSFGRLALFLYSALLAPIPFALARKLIAVSEPVADGLREMGVRKETAVIPNGISSQFLDFKNKEGHHPSAPFTILFVGRLDRSKGVRMLARAFSAFHARHPGSRLRYVGPDEGERAGLEKYAKENQFPVEFAQMPVGQMPAVYSSASLTVLPSEYEGFGLCILESWACGTPALSTAVGAAPLFTQSAFGPRAGEFLFRDEKELLERMEALYSTLPSERHLWTARARHALSAYGWDAVAKKTLDVIRN